MPDNTHPPAADPSAPTHARHEHRTSVRADISKLEAQISHYPEDAKAATRWLVQVLNDRFNKSTALMAAQLAKLGHPGREEYLYQVTSGRYFKTVGGPRAVASLSVLVDALRKWLVHSASAGKVQFNESLSCWRLVRDYIDAKRARDCVCRWGVVEAPTGFGKTECTQHYALLNNHGLVVRMESPARPSFTRFALKLGTKYGIATTISTYARTLAIERAVNDTRTIIIENCQRLYDPRKQANQEIFSYLQELQDDTQCTIILTWTPVFRKTIVEGADRQFFEQFLSRIGGVDEILTLPRPTRADLSSIAEQFGVTGGRDSLAILARWSQEPGPLRVLFHRLQKARTLARGAEITPELLAEVGAMPVVDTPEQQQEEDES